MQVQVVESTSELGELAGRWQRLAEACADGQATVFACPTWVLTWFDYFEAIGRPYVVLVWDGPDLVGVAPFSRTSLGVGPARFALLVSAGVENGYYGEPLLGPDPEPVARALAAHLSDLVAGGTTVVNLRRLWVDGALSRALHLRHEVTCRPMAPAADSAVVRFDQMDDVDRYFRQVARKHGITRRGRRLAEQVGTVDYHPDDSDVDGAIAALEDLLARRWEPGAGPQLFAGARRAAFTRHVLRALVDQGQAGLSTLRVDGRPVAVSVVFRLGDRAFSDFAAFDPEFAPFGVGQRELYEVLRHAWQDGATEVDLSAVSSYTYKLRWANATPATQSVALTAAGWRGPVAWGARRAMMIYRARRLARLHVQPATPPRSR